MAGLERRLEALEARAPQTPPIPRTLEEIGAIEAEITGLEVEMRREGVDPYRKPDNLRTNGVGHPMIPLDEHIAMLEAEIARCPDG